MNENEMKYIDRKIEKIKSWIKHYFSDLENLPQSSIDSKSIELDRKLELFYQLRIQKDIYMEEYHERK